MLKNNQETNEQVSNCWPECRVGWHPRSWTSIWETFLPGAYSCSRRSSVRLNSSFFNITGRGKVSKSKSPLEALWLQVGIQGVALSDLQLSLESPQYQKLSIPRHLAEEKKVSFWSLEDCIFLTLELFFHVCPAH